MSSSQNTNALPGLIPPRHDPHVRYSESGDLVVDGHSVAQMAAEHGTPFYVYSLPAVLAQYRRIRDAFTAELDMKKNTFHVHYAIKANSSMALLKALATAGCGFDCVSAYEVKKVLMCGCDPEHVVFAGVGKSSEELQYAVEQKVGAINCENEHELTLLQRLAEKMEVPAGQVRVALRLNPDVEASTHPSIATGSKAAKFGLPTEVVRGILAARKERWPLLNFLGLHVHIGSQLGTTQPTARAVQVALELLRPYYDEGMRWLDVGGGFPTPYDDSGDSLPEVEAFAKDIAPLVKGYNIGVEPGRYIAGRAGLLVSQVLYRKEQGGKRIAIVDASMVELMRPALYNAVHAAVPIVAAGSRPCVQNPHRSSAEQTHVSHHRGGVVVLAQGGGDAAEEQQQQQQQSGTAEVLPFQVVGPVCESTDVLSQESFFEDDKIHPGALVAFCTAGAYCSTMSGNYNARCRPPELVTTPDGTQVKVARQRETFDRLLQDEVY